MKTITEFSGLTVRRAVAIRQRLLGEAVGAEEITTRLGSELDLSGDRPSRLVEALEAVADAAERVRLVRVFGAEEEIKGAKRVGEFHYLVDLQSPMAAPAESQRGGKSGRRQGGRDRDRGAGGRSPRSGEKSAPGREDHSRGPMPSGGPGWTLSRAPAPPGERRGGGPGRGRPGGGRPGGGPGRPGGSRGPGGGPGKSSVR